MRETIVEKSLKVESVQEKETRKEDVETTEYRAVLVDRDKVWKVTVSSPDPIDGLSPGAILDVAIGTSQTTLREFKGE